MEKKWVHIIGIAGKTTAALAKLFKKDLGWKVTGSDQKKIYDPARSYLKKHKIPACLGYRSENLSSKVNLVVVGGSSLILDCRNPEYLKAKRLGLPIISHSQALARFLIKPESICIAGTYGKTTITALVTLILENAGMNPSFFIGEQPINFSEYLRLSDSSWSVVEADEYAYRKIDFDSGPRFLHYRPKYAIVTAAAWEHKDVYKKEEDYINAFRDFVRLIPKDGLLVAKRHGENIEKIVGVAKCRVVFYSPLSGNYQKENILAATTLCQNLGISNKVIKESIAQFKGVKRRLELIFQTGKIYFYDDFAQSPIRIRASLKVIREKFPKQRILVIFDPHATFLQKKEFLGDFRKAFCLADKVLISNVTFRREIPLKKQTTGKDLVLAIGKRKSLYLPLEEKLIEYVVEKVKRGGIIVFMSSGGLKGEKIKEKIIQRLKKGGSN